MMPSPETFSEACRKRGIKRGDHVVVYDSVGVFSAPRAAFTFDVGLGTSRSLSLRRALRADKSKMSP